jgi:2,3-bisphosphoglycerate-independent phosphoglycerate mutase
MAKSKKKKVALIIMDGMGIAPTSSGNAYALAKKPNLDKLFKLFPHTTLKASQEAVGLPKGQMGNSEVGHLNIGAGRIIYTGLTVIDKDIQEHKFEKNQAFLKAFKHVNKFHSKLHILGLVSDGGVHSSIDHCCELIKLANQMNIPTVLHCITDGRDTPPKSFVTAY